MVGIPDPTAEVGRRAGHLRSVRRAFPYLSQTGANVVRWVAILLLTQVLAWAGPRESILEEATLLIGTTEQTGQNDGVRIDLILASVGLDGTQAPYCAAFNRYAYDMAGLRTIGPRSALAAKWVSSPTWTRRRGGMTPLPGDPWGIWFASKGRIAHTGLVQVWGQNTVRTIEANTSPEAVPGSSADRDGDGIWSKRRLRSQIHSVRNWLD